MSHRLTEAQIAGYEREGYLTGLSAPFSADQMADHRRDYARLCELLEPGESVKEIREWHEASRWLYDICMNDRILDYAEGVLGGDFFLWASNFFAKNAGTVETVGWHQDAYYWPMAPHHSVTVWLAFTESRASNGAMRIVPGSHRAGLLKHRRSGRTDSVLTLECENGQFREDEAVTIELQPGEISLHDDRAVHGSSANAGEEPRVGLAIRYSGTDVRCDLSVNPHFKTYLCRGTDVFGHNPEGVAPTERFGRLHRDHASKEEAGTDEERASR